MILVFAIFIFSCTNEQEFRSFENTDSELWTYYANFEDEAFARGIEIDLNALNLSSSISNINGNGIAGSCQFHSDQPNVVTIDQEFWANASELIREMVVFHELGHCVLFRGHLENFNSEGTCISIMNSGLADCRVRYNENNRRGYLDELFMTE